MGIFRVLVQGRDYMSNLNLYNTKYGRFLLNPADMVSSYLIDGRFWEDELIQIFDKYLDKDSYVVEVGSYVGDHTVYLSKLCKQIYAYEGYRKTYYALLANLLLNDCDNVVPSNIIVGNGEFIRPMNLEDPHLPDLEQNNAGFRFVSEATSENQSIKLDELMFPHKIDMLKIDAEGMDLSIMMGARNLINRFHPVIIFEFNGLITQPFTEYETFLDDIHYSWEKISNWNYVAKYKGAER